MFLRISRLISRKGCGISLKSYGSLAESNEKLSLLINKLNVAQNGNPSNKRSTDTSKSQILTIHNENDSYPAQESQESAEREKCAGHGYDLPQLSHNPGDYQAYRENKDLIIDCFRHSLSRRTRNHGQISFLADSLNCILGDLEFPEIYRLIETILKRGRGEPEPDHKVASLLQNLLTRVNFLITEKLSYARGIVRVDTLPKYGRNAGCHGPDQSRGIDLGSAEHVEKLWRLWLELSRLREPESRYTISLLLSVLELETGRMFQFDLSRATRTLDVVVGEGRTFSKLEERLILRLLRRLASVLSHESDHSERAAYIKTNNVTPVLLKKIFCNLSRVSKTSPKILARALAKPGATQSLSNLAGLARLVLTTEHLKLREASSGLGAPSTELPDHLSASSSEVLSKFNKLLLKVFLYSVDLLKFFDSLTLDAWNKGPLMDANEAPHDLPSNLIALSHEALSRVTTDSPDSLVAECRAMYYLLLSSCLHGGGANGDPNATSDILGTVSEKISKVSRAPIQLNFPDEQRGPADQPATRAPFKWAQYLLYCDKIRILLEYAAVSHENGSKLEGACEALARQLSRSPESFMPRGANYGLSTLYVTLLNKYGLLRGDVYACFLGALGNWHLWRPNELSMLCDLISRTCQAAPNQAGDTSLPARPPHTACPQIAALMASVVDSLVDYLFHQGNLHRLGNNEFASVLGCMDSIDSLALPGTQSPPETPASGTSPPPTSVGSSPGTSAEAISVGTSQGTSSEATSVGEKAQGSGGTRVPYWGNEAVTRLVSSEIQDRMGRASFNQLLRLLKPSRLVGEETMRHVLSSVLSLEHLGDVSALAELGSPEATRAVLGAFRVEPADARALLLGRLLRNELPRRPGAPGPQGSYAPRATLAALERLGGAA